MITLINAVLLFSNKNHAAHGVDKMDRESHVCKLDKQFVQKQYIKYN